MTASFLTMPARPLEYPLADERALCQRQRETRPTPPTNWYRSQVRLSAVAVCLVERLFAYLMLFIMIMITIIMIIIIRARAQISTRVATWATRRCASLAATAAQISAYDNLNNLGAADAIELHLFAGAFERSN